MKVSIFAYGYLLTPEEIKHLRTEISLKDYDYIRNRYLTPLQSGEYLYGIILESVVENENVAFGELGIFKFNENSLQGKNLRENYSKYIKPILPEVENSHPNYMLAILEEEPDEF